MHCDRSARRCHSEKAISPRYKRDLTSDEVDKGLQAYTKAGDEYVDALCKNHLYPGDNRRFRRELNTLIRQMKCFVTECDEMTVMVRRGVGASQVVLPRMALCTVIYLANRQCSTIIL